VAAIGLLTDFHDDLAEGAAVKMIERRGEIGEVIDASMTGSILCCSRKDRRFVMCLREPTPWSLMFPNVSEGSETVARVDSMKPMTAI
jgi:hypothetical protein